jgi:hypothetical protein
MKASKDNVLLVPIDDPVRSLHEVIESHQMLQLVAFFVCIKAPGYNSPVGGVGDVKPVAGERALPADLG